MKLTFTQAIEPLHHFMLENNLDPNAVQISMRREDFERLCIVLWAAHGGHGAIDSTKPIKFMGFKITPDEERARA